MLSDYFNGQQPKFEMGDYVYICTHQKYGVITGRQYSPPPKNTFYYAIATSLDSYFQYFKEEVLTHIATMKYERDSRDNITSLYCEKFVEPLIFAQYVADFYLSLLQSLIQKFEAETEEIAYPALFMKKKQNLKNKKLASKIIFYEMDFLKIVNSANSITKN